MVATRSQVYLVRPGEVIHTPPGEEHWHGAVRDCFMVHLAMWEGDEVQWGAHVTPNEYEAALAVAVAASCKNTDRTSWNFKTS
ncbi:hypothetical protein ACLBYD_25825 [Rhodococcus sp. C26F]